MTSIVVTTNQSSIPGWATLGSFDAVIIAPSAQIIDLVTDYTVGSLFALKFDISGYVVVNSLNIGGDNEMVVGTTGTLHLLGDALRLGYSYLANYGTLTSNASAVFSAYGSEIYNAGVISANGSAVGMNLFGSGDRLINDGTLIGRGYSCVGITGGSSTIINHGEILAQGQPADSGEVAISVRGHAFIQNTGLIEGDAAGIRLEDASPDPVCDLYNAGTIRGAYSFFGIQGIVQDDSIVNRGLMDGNIYTSLGNDLVDTRNGTIDGNIQLSGGNDTLQGMGATITGIVDGSGGSDTYWTDDSDLMIFEGAENGTVDQVFARCNFRLADGIENLSLRGFADFQGVGNALGNGLQGNAGDNRLNGLAGADSITGDVGDDLITGGSQNDSLSGDDGHDTLLGGVGDDMLSGVAGNDLVLGGAGLDVMTGGLGEDVFQFTGIGQSTNLRLTADVITDFKQGEDHIDLSRIDANTTNAVSDDVFTFIGASAFTGGGGQLRSVRSAGQTFLEADVDANGTADFVIALTGGITMNVGDFFL